MKKNIIRMRAATRELRRHGEAGMSTAEYAVGTIAACAFAALLLAAALAPGVDPWLRGTRVARLARRAGDLSYGVFLWHVLVLQVVFAALGLTLFGTSPGWLFLLVVTASAAVAALSWWGVERPALRAARALDGSAPR